MSQTNEFKAQAKRLSDHLLKAHNITLGRGHSLEAIAAIHGQRDWNTLVARSQLCDANPRTEAAIPDLTLSGRGPEPLKAVWTAQERQQRAAVINATGVLHAQDRRDGKLDLYADDAVFDRSDIDWSQIFDGAWFGSVKLELDTLIDEELFAIGQAQ